MAVVVLPDIFAEVSYETIQFDFEKVLEKNEQQAQDDDEPQKPGEICKFYLKGSCMKGNSCPYRHSRNDRAVVCKHWLRGLCKKGDLCEFLHEYDMSKMPECYFFSKFGECSNPECVYLHIPPEVKYRDCPWYARGFCKHGPRCRHKHVKKVACENYLLGFCPNGPDCKYGHPKYELPKEGEGTTVKTPMICHKCGSIGHKALMCPVSGGGGGGMGGGGGGGMGGGRDLPPPADGGKPGLRSLDSVTCFKCGQMGHYANMCPNKRVPAPPGGYTLPTNMNGEVDPSYQQYANYQPQQQQQQQQNYYGGGAPPPQGGNFRTPTNFQNQIQVWGGN